MSMPAPPPTRQTQLERASPSSIAVGGLADPLGYGGSESRSADLQSTGDVVGATAAPTATWVTQATRNLIMDVEDTGCKVKYVIRDRDGKYPGPFDAILADADTKVVLSGVRMPRMNSIMERWIQCCRYELLDRTLTWNQAHLLRALHEYEHAT